MKSKRVDDKMNKDNLLMILTWISSCKYLIVAISYELPDVVIACIEHKVSLETLEQLGLVVKKHDNMKDVLVVDQSP